MATRAVAALRWMPAKSYGREFAKGRPIGVAIHCTESDNGAGTAESLAGPGWFGGPAGTSAHKMFDRDSGVEMVRRTRVAYHAGPKGNVCAVSYEFCGRAGWSREKWHAPEQLRMLDLAAPHIADDLRHVGAPARWLSLAQLADAARTGDQTRGGLFTHNDVRLALGGTTHSDPGKNFPYAYLLERVRAELDGTTTPALEEDWFDMATKAELGELINDALDAHRKAGHFQGLTPGEAEQANDTHRAAQEAARHARDNRADHLPGGTTHDRDVNTEAVAARGKNLVTELLQRPRVSVEQVAQVLAAVEGVPAATLDEAVRRLTALAADVAHADEPEATTTPEPAAPADVR